MIFEKGDRIVFAGDSVTDMGSTNPVGEGLFDSLGRSYVRVIENMMYTWYPELRVRVTNSGISGNNSCDLLARFDRDVIDLKPDWISICIGINDVWRQFDVPGMTEFHISPETYESNMRAMIEKAKSASKGVFICTPYMMEPLHEDMMRARMDEYSGICRKLAEEYGCILVDFQKMYEDYLHVHHSALIAWDRIHPNQIGATIMAKEFLSHCDFDYSHDYRKNG